ncbi:intracellular ribonuclease LX-like [Coffea arabica]|uniref:Intracellular ribonuclease LX-like n=1 Tax=Coffea arabica TaxID=13443 RepID=A0A6P6V2L5_COFAR|nr:intracellular ribonuclease LX-like [Coffea arabica]
MKLKSAAFLTLLVLQCLAVLTVAQNDFDFFYLVQQWPASYCDTKRSCCYPTTGKPAEDFSIHGLWPNRNDGSWPSNCDEGSSFDESEVSDLVKRMQQEWPSLACPSSDGVRFWSHEWEKHGTCSLLNEHQYFQTALDLKDKSNLLQVLKDAGIRPGKFYSLEKIKEAIQQGVGYTPFIECNVDQGGNRQLYQVYLCVDSSASDFIECPTFPHGRCGSEIEFPSFSSLHDEA